MARTGSCTHLVIECLFLLRRSDLRGEIPQRESREGSRNQKKKDDKACWENKAIGLAAVTLELLELKRFSWLTRAEFSHQLAQEKAV